MQKREDTKERIMEEEPIGDIFGDSRRWLFAIIVLLVLLGAIGGYYFHALKNVRMEGMDITDISIGDGAGIMLEGDMQLHNPSALPLDIEEIDYDITLEGKHIGSGRIHGDRIPSGRRATMLFEQSIDLAESVTDAVALAGKDRIIVMMRGTITMSFLGVRMKLPFREEQDIRPLIESKLKSTTAWQREVVDDVVGRAFS